MHAAAQDLRPSVGNYNPFNCQRMPSEVLEYSQAQRRSLLGSEFERERRLGSLVLGHNIFVALEEISHPIMFEVKNYHSSSNTPR